ncbi:hypothetical protein L798_13880 [Zootermopsis nevadensis]|uniref:Secreted protein n=1 Tax=Zootermopsis nevadensis TaxID=136037 RepID=A0A067RV24_ZOONE|nr:hypothetical protein L798_13880 [Zootermopsis nevadensis]
MFVTFFCVVLSCVQVEALRQTNPSSKKSYQMSLDQTNKKLGPKVLRHLKNGSFPECPQYCLFILMEEHKWQVAEISGPKRAEGKNGDYYKLYNLHSLLSA